MCIQAKIISTQIVKTHDEKIAEITCEAIILPNGRNIKGHMSIDSRGYVTIFEDNSEKIYVLKSTDSTLNIVNQTIDVIEIVQKQN